MAAPRCPVRGRSPSAAWCRPRPSWRGPAPTAPRGATAWVAVPCKWWCDDCGSGRRGDSRPRVVGFEGRCSQGRWRMDFRDAFDPMFRGKAPRVLTDEERLEDAIRLTIAKYRTIFKGRAPDEVERIIIEDIGQEAYARYGGIQVASRGADHGPRREPDWHGPTPTHRRQEGGRLWRRDHASGGGMAGHGYGGASAARARRAGAI